MMMQAEQQHTTELKRTGHRKPLQMELIGGKNARQRIWEELRKTSDATFETYPIARAANVDDDALRTYLQCLTAGGFVEHVSGVRYERRVYRLLKDTGIEAPRLTRKGEPVKQGQGAECMWRTLRMLGEMDVTRLVSHAAASGIDVAPSYAKTYISLLRKAGYLITTLPSTPHRMERFRLSPQMNTGPRPPQIQRVKTVYDPNLNKVMWAEDPEELS
ncbi:hypothetical protein [Neptunomonas antarctica]|nr:hypothetical protein [Neptunomonas antarctica]